MIRLCCRIPRILGVSCCIYLAASDVAAQKHPGLEWDIATHPEIMIGETLGPDVYLFHSIVSARFLPDGRIVVADAGFRDVRIFERDGTFQTRFGRPGQGPREFSAINGLWLTPKGLIGLWDATNRRITLLDLRGVFQSTHPVRVFPPGGNLELFLGSYSNGDVVLGSLILGNKRPGAPALVPDRVVFGRFSLHGEYKRILGEANGLWRYQRNAVPFSSVPAAVLLRDSIYIVDDYRATISVRDSRGVSVREIDLPPIKEEPADAVWSSLESRLRENNKELFLEQLRQGAVPRAGRFPQIAALLRDDVGYIWVKAYDPYKDSIWLKENAMFPARGGEWRVIHPGGKLVATVRMPDRVRPTEINGKRLLGVETDQLGVQRIVVYAIHRN